MQGWMSRDGERRAVPAPTCSAGLAQAGGTRLALPTKPNRPGEGRRREETDAQTQAPRKAPLLACQAGLYHEAWMCGESHSSAHALQQLPAPTGTPDPHRPSRHTAPAPSANPLPKLTGWREGRPPGWGRVLGLPSPGPSPPQQERARMAGIAFGGRGWRGRELQPLPQSLRQQEMGGMPAPLLPPPPGDPDPLRCLSRAPRGR